MNNVKLFMGACDASGVVLLDQDHFASGTDEANRVSIHALEGGGEPLSAIDLDHFLGARWKEKKERYSECDLESATALGDLTLWIASHGRNKKGEFEPDRHRLFALRVLKSGQAPRLEPFGTPYRKLLEDLLNADFPKAWNLVDAAEGAPQQAGGLNIEAICSTFDGSVWIGFRNPIPEGQAILVELLNPLDLISMPDAQSKFGRFVSLNLGGRGIRDMTCWGDRYLILAGAFDDTREFALFEWNGNENPPVALPLDPAEGGLNPEGLLVFSDNFQTVHIFSDDDSVMVDGQENKELPQEKRTFRALRLNVSGELSHGND